MRTHPLPLAAVVLTAALCFVPRNLPSAEPTTSSASTSPRRDWSLRQTPVVEVVKRVRDAVVNIHSERTVQAGAAEEFFAMAPSQNRVNGMGTGIIIDPRGYVVTNYHVIEDVNSLRVRLADGTTVAGKVVARDHDNDLALLKIDVNRLLPTMPLGTAADLMVGETVVAIGNAYGYEHTVSVGVVSAIGRDVTLNKELSYKSLIQTDASINPGNSGGPLLNVYGELIGVNVAIRAGAQGIGFAIPVDTMIRVACGMLAGRGRGSTASGMLVKDDVRTSHEESPQRTVLIDRLDPNGAAAKAGLKRGDVLVKVGDVSVATSLDVERGLFDRMSGDKVQLVVRRGDGEQKLELTVETATPRAVVAVPVTGDATWRRLGLRLAPANPESVTRVKPQLRGGLLVTEVRPSGTADKAGIQRGDILVGLHNWEMLTLENVQYVLNHADLSNFSPLQFYVIRAGQFHRGALTPAD
jgi:serine protease Do